jgi:NADP-dependent 3-hydroxy acid dehydrogenase YdfG
MSTDYLIVTGAAPHSVGEAFVRAILSRTDDRRILALDRSGNADLRGVPRLRQLVIDLNPLRGPGNLEAFAKKLRDALEGALADAGPSGVGHLVQCAGLYDFGTFLDHDVKRRRDVLGLNVLGTTEVLHAVMGLNRRLQRNNSTDFSHILLGSFQGLYARERRPIYAPSKAYGIDLCTSLAEGAEVARCVYFAAGPIDTPMLHRNHWVKKANGSETFFEEMLRGPRERYTSIFVRCDETALDLAAGDGHRFEAESLRLAMARYEAERRAAFSGELGVLGVEACGRILADIVESNDLPSGVYINLPAQKGARLVLSMVPFRDLDRARAFRAAAKNVPLG